MVHDLCPSCGSDVYLDLLHYVTAYRAAVGKYVDMGREDIASAIARRSATLYRKNRQILAEMGR